MTPRPPKRAAGFAPVTRQSAPGSATPDADPAGALSPPSGAPAQTSRPAVPNPAPGGTPSPAGEGRRRAAGASPAGLQGAEWQKAAKAELSRQGCERRRRAHRYVPVAKRTAYRPGMVRKMPPARQEAS